MIVHERINGVFWECRWVDADGTSRSLIRGINSTLYTVFDPVTGACRVLMTDPHPALCGLE